MVLISATGIDFTKDPCVPVHQQHQCDVSHGQCHVCSVPRSAFVRDIISISRALYNRRTTTDLMARSHWKSFDNIALARIDKLAEKVVHLDFGASRLWMCHHEIKCRPRTFFNAAELSARVT